MNKYLFLFSIGPVQSFIANSRKMRDLYSGSFLLSYLVLHICKFIDANKDTSIKIERILPIDLNQKNGQIANAPNRILLRIEFSDGNSIDEKMNKLAESIEKELRTEFKKIYEDIFSKCGITVNSSIENQLKDFPEVYYVYQEYTSGESFNEISSKLQAVKTIQTFSQTNEKAGRKCSLFPEYNALFYKSKDGQEPKFKVDEAINIGKIKKCFYALNPGEAVCSKAFVKRMMCLLSDENFRGYKYNEDIVSVAYMLLRDRVSGDSNGQALLNKLSREAAEAVFDLQNKQLLSDDEYSTEDQKAAQELYDYLKAEKISPYYAVLKFDGDGIGDLYRKCSESEQTKLSKDIGEFAAQVPDIMDSYNGMCIYAGGEDFLGFLPVAKAIPAIKEFRELFQKTVHNPTDLSKRLTLSAGIVFAHLMPPLKKVLELTDEMGREAKCIDGKDSFSLCVLYRSGKKQFSKNTLAIIIKT